MNILNQYLASIGLRKSALPQKQQVDLKTTKKLKLEQEEEDRQEAFLDLFYHSVVAQFPDQQVDGVEDSYDVPFSFYVCVNFENQWFFYISTDLTKFKVEPDPDFYKDYDCPCVMFEPFTVDFVDEVKPRLHSVITEYAEKQRTMYGDVLQTLE